MSRLYPRDADVRGMQRGSIVDSVSHEADHVSLAAEKANDPLLVSRSKTSEKRRLFGRIRQFRVRHLLHGLARSIGSGSRPTSAHLAADQVIIAGKDLHSSRACAAPGLRLPPCPWAGREMQRTLSARGRARPPLSRTASGQFLDGHGQHPEAVAAEARIFIPQAFHQSGIMGESFPSSSN